VRIVLKVDFDVRMLYLYCFDELEMHEVVVCEHQRTIISGDDGSAVALEIKRSV